MTTISRLLRPEMVSLELEARTRDEAIAEIVGLLAKDPRVGNPKQFLDEVMAREASESTCIGSETAIPHARTDLVHTMVMAAGRSRDGVTFGCGKLARFIFVIAGPRPVAPEYLRFLGALARRMRSDDVRARLLSVADEKEFIRILGGAGVE